MLQALLVVILLSVSLHCAGKHNTGKRTYDDSTRPCDLAGSDIGPGPFPDFAEMVTATLLESDKESLRNGTCTGTLKAFPEGVAGNLTSIEIEQTCESLDASCLHSCVALAKGEAAYMLYYQVMDVAKKLGPSWQRPEHQACLPSPVDPREYWDCLKLPPLPERLALFLNWVGDSARPATVHVVGDFLAGGRFIHISGSMHDQGCDVEGFGTTMIPNLYDVDRSSSSFRDQCAYEFCRIRGGQYLPTGLTVLPQVPRVPSWKRLLAQDEEPY